MTSAILASGTPDASGYLPPSGTGISSRYCSVARLMFMYTVVRRRLLTLLSSKRLLEIIQSIDGDTILPGSNGRYLSSITLNV